MRFILRCIAIVGNHSAGLPPAPPIARLIQTQFRNDADRRYLRPTNRTQHMIAASTVYAIYAMPIYHHQAIVGSRRATWTAKYIPQEPSMDL